MKRYPDGWERQELLPEAGAVARAGLDRDGAVPRVDEGRGEARDRLPAGRRRARAPLGGQHGVHRHARLGVAGRPAGQAGLGHVRPRPVRGIGLRRGDRGRAAREAGARRPRAGVGAEDERVAGHPRARPDHEASSVRRGARVRGHRRRRPRARASGPGHDRVDTREAQRRARRREPERSGEDDRVRVLRPAPGGCARLDAAPLGRGEARARDGGVHDGRRARPRRTRGRSLRTRPRAAVSRSARRSARSAERGYSSSPRRC